MLARISSSVRAWSLQLWLGFALRATTILALVWIGITLERGVDLLEASLSPIPGIAGTRFVQIVVDTPVPVTVQGLVQVD